MDDLDRFRKRWENRCIEIKTQTFSASECATLDRQFTLEIGLANIQRGWNLSATDIVMFESDLRLALHVAFANFRKQGNWIARTFKDIRLPDLVLTKP